MGTQRAVAADRTGWCYEGVEWAYQWHQLERSYTLVRASNYQLLSNPSLVCTRWPISSSGGSLSFSVLLAHSYSAFGSMPSRKEVGIPLSNSQAGKYLGSFITESILIAIPALVSAYYLANYTARAIGSYCSCSLQVLPSKPAGSSNSNLGGGLRRVRWKAHNKTLSRH